MPAKNASGRVSTSANQTGSLFLPARVAEPEIQVRQFARLGNRIRGKGGRWKMGGVLQPQTPTFRPWRQATRRGLLAEKKRNPNRSAGAKSSFNLRRKLSKDWGVAYHHDKQTQFAEMTNRAAIDNSS